MSTEKGNHNMENNTELSKKMSLLIRACDDQVLDSIGAIQEIVSLLPNELALKIIDELFTDFLEEAYDENSENL